MSQEDKKRIYLAYSGGDFILYVFAAGCIFALSVFALQRSWQLAAVGLSLIFMVLVFVRKWGLRFDASAIRTLFSGTIEYVIELGRLCRLNAKWLIWSVAFFAGACVAERALLTSNPQSRWLAPVPYYLMFEISFGLITAVRTILLFVHLTKQKVIFEVLTEVPYWKKTLNRIPIWIHCVHSYATGMLCHLALWLPGLILWRLTHPTMCREVILIAGGFLWALTGRIHSPGKVVIPFGSDLFTIDSLFHVVHRDGHESRFFFTVFHGQHHDAIPTALLGSAGGTGLMENVDRNLHRANLFQAVSAMTLLESMAVLFDMFGHQHIPGVLPKVTLSFIRLGNHHVVHHFGKLLPLGFMTDEEYKPDNSVARWYLATVERVQGIDAKVSEEFLSVSMKRADVEQKLKAKSAKKSA